MPEEIRPARLSLMKRDSALGSPFGSFSAEVSGVDLMRPPLGGRNAAILKKADALRACRAG